MPQDYVLDGHGAICLDTLSDGGAYMKSDDYCFVLGENLAAYVGDGSTTLMKAETPLCQYVEAARGISGSNNPYESNDHVTYEFKIPSKEFGTLRTDYVFYVTYDTRGQTNNFTYDYSWPESRSAAFLHAASPRAWGQISLFPDANAPEFPVSVIGVVAGIIGIVTILSRAKLFRALSRLFERKLEQDFLSKRVATIRFEK